MLFFDLMDLGYVLNKAFVKLLFLDLLGKILLLFWSQLLSHLLWVKIHFHKILLILVCK